MTTPTASTRAHMFRDVRDSDGNVTPNVKVTVYERGSTQLLQQVIYAAPSGSTTLANPFTTSTGLIDLYLASPQDVAIGVSVAAEGGAEQRFEDVPVMPPSDQLVRSPVGFQITNAPLPASYLQGSDNNTAMWVTADEIMASRPTPTVTLKEYDFSASFLDDLVVPVGTSSYVPVDTDVKPTGYGFLQALAFTSTVSVPVLNFAERGRVIFTYKVLSDAQGEGAARVKVSVDDDTVWTITPVTPDFVGTWLVGYLEIMTPGSHKIVFSQLAGADPTSSVLLGPLTIEYGNNMPPHNHTGAGDQTVSLGTGAVAPATRGTAVGDTAKSLDDDGTALGASSVAYARATAVGSHAWASADSTSIGYRAGGASSATEFVAIGSQSLVAGDSGVAIGYDTGAVANAVAIGPVADASGEDSIAVGHMALAEGYRAIALGSGASAGFDYSMAIGPGVSAQAPHEARLGDGQTVVVMPGSLRHTGPSAVLGSPGTLLGFYGAQPVTQPVVRGSRNGNGVLTQLLAQLDAMGLVDDRSTP